MRRHDKTVVYMINEAKMLFLGTNNFVARNYRPCVTNQTPKVNKLHYVAQHHIVSAKLPSLISNSTLEPACRPVKCRNSNLKCP